MITLQLPDIMISALLGEDKGVSCGDAVRPSQFTVALYLNKRRVIFNTLTGQCIESDYFSWFEHPENRPFDMNDLEMSLLVRRDFLVAVGTNELERYSKLKKTIHTIKKEGVRYTEKACKTADVYCDRCAMLPICSNQMARTIDNRDCYDKMLAIEIDKLHRVESEGQLPPVTISVGKGIIRVTEPTVEFIEKINHMLVADYMKADETVNIERAESIISGYDKNEETSEERKKRLIRWASIEKELLEANRVLDPPRYVVLKDKKLIYLVNSKVACSSILASMLGKATSNDYSVHDMANEMNLIHNDIDDFDDYYVFTFVRNPFERLVSCYESKYHTDIRSRRRINSEFEYYLDGYLREDKGFDVFCDRVCEIPWRLMDRHIKPQYKLIYDEDGRCMCDYVGKLENVNKEFVTIRNKYGLSPLPHYNASHASDWRWYYTADSARKIYEKYKEDFQAFGYEGSYEALLTFLDPSTKRI